VAISMLEHLEGGEDLRGAVLLTYTLSLNFFEQLVAPRLDKVGCSNVLILADRHGYDDTLTKEPRSLTGVGTRYVCAPLLNSGGGVQHAKAILLAGSHRAHLLIGSGNLSLYGYCRNLELFAEFELDIQEEQPVSREALYPFITIWQLLMQIKQSGDLPSAATERLDAIQDIAPWLSQPAQEPADFRIWHNFEQPLFARLADLDPVEELQIIAPFIELNTVAALVKQLEPKHLVMGVDSLSPNLDGPGLAANSESWGCKLEVRALGSRDGSRSLHAKALIGIGPQGSWCFSGSSNCTPPAILAAWTNGGNLELGVWQRSLDPDAFRGLWQDEQIVIYERNPASIHLAPQKSSDGDTDISAYPVRLLELRCEDRSLEGRYKPYGAPRETTHWELEFLRQRNSLPLEPGRGNRFRLVASGELTETEAARIVLWSGDRVVGFSPYHWIDQPARLAHYGQRSYYTRVKENLKTFDGAGKLFEELLNFLWGRVDPKAIQGTQDEEQESIHRRYRGRGLTDEDHEQDAPPPPPSAFITDEELSLNIGQWIEDYAPYDRSTLSLRDLLSLALLRLTAETGEMSTSPGDDRRDEEADSNIDAAHEIKQRDALLRIRNYLMSYCHRYAGRLVDPVFVSRAGPELLLENHYTLSRVLLEFFDKEEWGLFSSKDLRDCVLCILGGVFYPQLLDAYKGKKGAWDVWLDFGIDVAQLRRAWHESGLSALVVLLIVEAWGEIPHWSKLLHDEPATRAFMSAKALIDRLERESGSRFWEGLEREHLASQDLWGFRRIADLFREEENAYTLEQAIGQFELLGHYRTPVEEKYADLLDWWKLRQQCREHTAEAKRLVARISHAGYDTELRLLRTLIPTCDILAVEGDSEYCPRCFTRLTGKVLWNLKKGNLQLCSNCGQVALYWKPKGPR